MPLEARFSDPEPGTATLLPNRNGAAAPTAATLILQPQPS